MNSTSWTLCSEDLDVQRESEEHGLLSNHGCSVFLKEAAGSLRGSTPIHFHLAADSRYLQPGGKPTPVPLCESSVRTWHGVIVPEIFLGP